jgi:hypothetical protein
MRTNPPSEELVNLIKQPQFQARAIYLQGNVMHKKDLQRSKAEEASCAVILSKKNCTNP